MLSRRISGVKVPARESRLLARSNSLISRITRVVGVPGAVRLLRCHGSDVQDFSHLSEADLAAGSLPVAVLTANVPTQMNDKSGPARHLKPGTETAVDLPATLQQRFQSPSVKRGRLATLVDPGRSTVRRGVRLAFHDLHVPTGMAYCTDCPEMLNRIRILPRLFVAPRQGGLCMPAPGDRCCCRPSRSER